MAARNSGCAATNRRSSLDVAPAYERAEPQAVIANGNIAEPGQPSQINEQARGRQAKGKNRHQAMSAGDDQCVGIR
jgi:hypothetical protein